ncbi:MAG TPA: DNA starvation/stationary phase protection protein [Stellaceae bacterium]|nr:DNA starvation/stationary phase protection protein [Stellaceae bacterium]
MTTAARQGSNAIMELAGALNALVADYFALYIKTKNYHWHVSGPHFRDYHLLLDDQATQLLETTDPIAERVRKLGGTTVKSIGEIGKLQRVNDDNADGVAARAMLETLMADNKALVGRLREAHALCDEHEDVATASLIETWIDEAEGRAWFLYEATRSA